MLEEGLIKFFLIVAAILVILTVYNFIMLCGIERKLYNKDKNNDRG